jgi:hypothetical protein
VVVVVVVLFLLLCVPPPLLLRPSTATLGLSEKKTATPRSAKG